MEILITMTGLQHYIEPEELNPHQQVILKKEPENKYDQEAIAIYLNDTIKIGYVANSVHTQAKGTYSAGRLYDKIPEMTKAKILVIMHQCAIGVVSIEK